jgi:carbon storage regulator CsrA
MLVLTRKYQEKIRIGNDITITVLRTKGKAVRLGIEAPATVPVIRGELQFEDQSVAAVDVAASGSATAAGTRGRSRESIAQPQPAWTTRTRAKSDGAARRRSDQTAVEVGHRRVPRQEMPELLPHLLSSGNGPLRAMMDQRSATA